MGRHDRLHHDGDLFLVGRDEDAHCRAAIEPMERFDVGIVAMIPMTLQLAYSRQLVDDISIEQTEQGNAEDSDEHYLQNESIA